MAEFIARMFTPSNSDGSGESRPAPAPAPRPKEKAAGRSEKVAKGKTRSRFGGAPKKTGALANTTSVAGQADVVRKTLLGQ